MNGRKRPSIALESISGRSPKKSRSFLKSHRNFLLAVHVVLGVVLSHKVLLRFMAESYSSEECKAMVNAKDLNGRTALHLSSWSPRLQCPGKRNNIVRLVSVAMIGKVQAGQHSTCNLQRPRIEVRQLGGAQLLSCRIVGALAIRPPALNPCGVGVRKFLH